MASAPETTYTAALLAGRRALAASGIGENAPDARLLLANAASLDMAGLIAAGSEELPALAAAAYDRHIERRAAGEPLALIIGRREFWGLSLEVNAATLVPRPDTETLVEAVLEWVGHRRDEPLAICDLGTGSGAILLALLSELPKAQGAAVDLSAPALEMARRNAEALGMADRVSFHLGDYAEKPEGRFDIVVSNPPYIPSGAIGMLDGTVRDFEPHLALDGGPDGLAAYRTIVPRARRILVDGGLLALEVGHGQSEAVAGLCREGLLNEVAIRSDLAGIGRVVTATTQPLSSPG